MAIKEPLGYVIDEVTPLAAQAIETRENLVGEVTQGAGEVAAHVALEEPPLALLRIQVG